MHIKKITENQVLALICSSNNNSLLPEENFPRLSILTVKVCLVVFLTNNKYYSQKQYGFQSKLNTSGSLTDFISQTYSVVNEGKICAGIFVVVMKAFDTVEQCGLC